MRPEGDDNRNDNRLSRQKLVSCGPVPVKRF